MGVGNGSQSCTHNCHLPIVLRQASGGYTAGVLEAPIVPKSDLPGLLGLRSMQNSRATLDLTTNQMHLCGPGDVSIILPSGTETYQLEIAPSGHLVLPCCNFTAASRSVLQPQLENRQRSLLVPSAVEENPQGS